MKYFTENATGEVYGYDSKTQADLINKVDLTSFSVVPSPPAEDETWDGARRKWRVDATKVAEKKHREISNEYKAKLDAGVTYKGTVFQSDEKAVMALVTAVAALATGWTLPGGHTWVDMANVEHPADAAWLKGLLKAFANHKASLFARKVRARKRLKQVKLGAKTAEADIKAISF